MNSNDCKLSYKVICQWIKEKKASLPVNNDQATVASEHVKAVSFSNISLSS